MDLAEGSGDMHVDRPNFTAAETVTEAEPVVQPAVLPAVPPVHRVHFINMR